MQRPVDVSDRCRDGRRLADHGRLVQSHTIEQRLRAAAKTFEAVLAKTFRSMDLLARSLCLLDRPVYRPPLIARRLEPATGKLPTRPDGRG